MTTKNIEKEFRIELIASLLENRLLNCDQCSVTEEDLYELCSFITNIEVNNLNFYYIGSKARNILLELQPELNIRINHTQDRIMDFEIKMILNIYKQHFGEKYKIKSIKKCIIKSLEIQS